MKGLKRVLLFFVILLVSGTIGIQFTSASGLKEKKLDDRTVFNHTEGTSVIKNLKTGQTYIFNPKRSKERFTPESTFKVLNALIGLQAKAVRDEYEVKRWDGITREIPDWNRDHTLASGMRYSVIWYYQDMARDIGQERMQDYVTRVGYGNRDISGGIDHFWLSSSLKISALEQVQFMERLVKEKLPFDEQVMRTVKRIMINEEADSYVIHGKTGTRLSDMGLGWYSGYVETKKGKWAFATNVDNSGTVAKTITLEELKDLKIIKD
ncbi:beta-lactamase class D [Fictibacillus solisalsi]|uniref:Beta-lactamase n=1 Tax=Fictibacillus solisalsi TaxID=459525 RepID=A0A1G9THB8_9BACL|nr:class D beta-lactamase [Fictibacillus solisalsi]SDM46948.1 beta-lactamase class D [Fictibacillus solisalsi]